MHANNCLKIMLFSQSGPERAQDITLNQNEQKGLRIGIYIVLANDFGS